ncbi:MAG: hypothetical protein IMX00_00045 [Limnochordales bacterium]|nr:hypothetical protein [Limnochordales bacterium]
MRANIRVLARSIHIKMTGVVDVRRIGSLVIAVVLVLGIGISASAQGQISFSYWPQDTEVTFAAANVQPQLIKSHVVSASGVMTLLPRLALWGEYAVLPEAEGKQGSSKFTLAGSQMLIVGSYQLLNEGGLSLSPAFGYVSANNEYTWQSGGSSVSYTVAYSGLVVGGVARVELARGFNARVTVLHGPKLTVKDTAQNRPADSYDSALTDVTAAVSVNVFRNLAVEVGYRGISQLARVEDSDVWERTSNGFFAAAKVEF